MLHLLVLHCSHDWHCCTTTKHCFFRCIASSQERSKFSTTKERKKTCWEVETLVSTHTLEREANRFNILYFLCLEFHTLFFFSSLAVTLCVCCVVASCFRNLLNTRKGTSLYYITRSVGFEDWKWTLVVCNFFPRLKIYF
jgi:hypothetical protein